MISPKIMDEHEPQNEWEHMNMNLRQQIIQDRADTLATMLHINTDLAFLRLTHSLITGRSVHAFDFGDLVDGGQDKQIDVITIEEDQQGADVYIVQTKNSQSFSSNALIQLRNGLQWMFQRPRKELDTLANKPLRDKILEYRATQTSLGPSNLRIHVRFVANADFNAISDEFRQELLAISNDYNNGTFEEFSIQPIGYDALIELSKIQERNSRSVNANLKIKYDANTPSLIRYFSQDLRGIVCTVPGSEIARLVNNNPDGAIFDANIRRFLGSRGGVNRDIMKTCSSLGSSYEFWFLNNGITIVCDECDPVTDPDNPQLKIKNLQIVNGCQTATTLALAQKNGQLAADVRVITRIYETNDPDLVSRIVLTTNNQNEISSRDLRANDPVQIDMEHGFAIHGYYYERKPRQFDDKPIDVTRLFVNEEVGQWYLAIVLKTPSDARARKYKVWGELHARVFSGDNIEPYIIAGLLGRRVSQWLHGSEFADSDNESIRSLARRGSFHVARISAFLWKGEDEWKSPTKLKGCLTELENNNPSFEKILNKAFQTLLSIVQKDDYIVDLDRALKSSTLDRDIDRRLHQDIEP